MALGEKLQVGYGKFINGTSHDASAYRTMNSQPDHSSIEASYRALQDQLCTALTDLDGTSRFESDRWDRVGGGGGDTRILCGDFIEKAAVNFSAVWGNSPPLLRERGEGDTFFATGVSMIVHPRNPYAPTYHANVRYFETDVAAWFGGGADLTPWYVNDADIRHFHQTLRAVCDRHPSADYATWKQTCDDYFFLPHRREARGVGGIFFDNTNMPGTWEFQQDLGQSLMPAYLPIVERHTAETYGPAEQAWMRHRRGRYAEFNLAWDRGTKFGLQTGGRAESILASLPPTVTWGPYPDPATGTPEASLLELVQGTPRTWA